MPLYSFRCEQCSDEREHLVSMGQKVTACTVCGGKATYQLSFKTVSIGLPNGHIAIRGKSRGK